MKSLSLGTGSAATKARKINMEDSGSDSEMEDEGQAAALSVPRVGQMSAKNRIKKERKSISRAEEQALKKLIRKRMSTGDKSDRKMAKKMRLKLEEGLAYRNGTVQNDSDMSD